MVDEKMIITIGREHGTMGDKVAEKFEDNLNCHFMTRRIF